MKSMKLTVKRLSVAVVAVLVSATAIGAEKSAFLRLERDFATTKEVEASPLYRKKIAFIGDSYVQNHARPISESWHYLLAEKYQMHYWNFGRNGNCMVLPRSQGEKTMCKRYVDIPKDVDYIVVVGGHNDTGVLRRLGDGVAEADAAEVRAKQEALLAEFKSGFRRFVAALKADYPKAKIVFVTPWAVDRPFFPEIIATIKAETAVAGVSCYDAASLSGVNPNDAEYRKRYFQSTKDTAHLNAAGHKRMFGKIESFFNSL